MTEYLVASLKERYETATLSRGYKRKTKGFAIAHENSTALEIGDEPMQFHEKFPDVTVAVGEERLVAIPQLLHEEPGTQVIVLDDAFQHRTVHAGLNILLTDYKNLYTRDFMLPTGDLRDVKSSSKRAQIIIVTKCNADLSIEEKESLIHELQPLPHQKVYFTEITYSRPYHLFNKSTGNIGPSNDILLLCGIANPKPLMEFLTRHVHSYDMIRYTDHHIFTIDDLKEIKKYFEKLQSSDKFILTTEKDAVRLEKFRTELQDFPIYVLPIKHRFLFDEKDAFDKQVTDFVESFTAVKPAS